MRRHLRGWLAIVLTACGGGEGGSSNAAPPSPTDEPATACAEGFRALADHAGCEPILPSAKCAPGTGPRIGSTSCLPVGVTSCPAGFVKHASGWGCDVVLPAAACASATRERLGAASCTPLSDCKAAFPPAAATLFVDASYPPGALDAAHFTTITEALAAAPAGATIAVEAGTYAEKLTPTRPVTIIGRCAEQVVLATNDGTGPGLRADNVDVAAKNLTLRGFKSGATVAGGAVELSGVVVEGSTVNGISASSAGTRVRLSNVVVRGTRVFGNNNQAYGVVAQNGGLVEMDDSVVADSDFANVVSTGGAASVVVTRSIIRDGRAPATGAGAGSFGVGVFVTNGGKVAIAESALVDNAADGLLVGRGVANGKPSSGSIARSVVRGTKLDPVRDIGRGLEVGPASSLSVEQCTIFGSAQLDVLATDEGATLDLHDSTTFGSASGDASAPASPGLLVSDKAKATARSVAFVSARNVGVQVEAGGDLTLEDSLVLDARPLPQRDGAGLEYGFGISVQDASTLTMRRSVIDGAHTIGLLAEGASTVRLEQSLVTRTVGSSRGESGRGISAQDGAKLEVDRSAVLDNLEVGIMVIDGGASLALRDSTIGATRFDSAGRFGMGLFLAGGVMGTLERSTITGSQGIGLAAAGAGGFVRSSFVSGNAVGVHVQDGATLVESEAPSGDPLQLTFSADTRLVGNATRTGSGSVALPTILPSGN